MWKPVVVATAALAIAGSSIVYAQQPFGESDGYRDGPRFEHRHRHLSPEDRAAFVDARIAALKAGLELTADQAKNWPAFEQALRDMAQLRAQRRAAREAREQNASQAPRSIPANTNSLAPVACRDPLWVGQVSQNPVPFSTTTDPKLRLLLRSNGRFSDLPSHNHRYATTIRRRSRLPFPSFRSSSFTEEKGDSVLILDRCLARFRRMQKNLASSQALLLAFY